MRSASKRSGNCERRSIHKTKRVPPLNRKRQRENLRILERNEQANEIDCVNTLAKARQMLVSPVAPTAVDRYARDRSHQ
jgi:hypothetical protein